MVKSKQTVAMKSRDDSGARPTGTRGPAWNDPAIPAGDAPPLPLWPLELAAVAWVGWLVFLLVMMAMRIGSSGA